MFYKLKISAQKTYPAPTVHGRDDSVDHNRFQRRCPRNQPSSWGPNMMTQGVKKQIPEPAPEDQFKWH